jgi:hypothetical protein
MVPEYFRLMAVPSVFELEVRSLKATRTVSRLRIFVLAAILGSWPGATSTGWAQSGTLDCSSPPADPTVQIPDDFLANWMGYMQPYFQKRTLFEMSLPGTHDTVTYDLTTNVASAAWKDTLANSMLHAIKDIPGGSALLGEAAKPLAVAQTLNVTQQLDAGARFLDIRATWEPDEKKWYGYHTVLTANTLESYLQEIAGWVRKHPSEIVVIWLSFHGEECPKDHGKTPTFIGATPTAYSSLASLFEDAFGALLATADDSTYAEYLKSGQRVLVYALDYQRFPSDFQAKAFDSCPSSGCPGGRCGGTGRLASKGGICGCSVDDLTNVVPGGGVPAGFNQYLSTFGAEQATRQKSRSLQLVSAAASAPSSTDFIVAQVVLAHFHNLATKETVSDCRAAFSLPPEALSQLDCPPDLGAISRAINFYLQRSLDYALEQQDSEPQWGLPMALYLDQLLADGTIDTGAVAGGGLGANQSKYAFVPALLCSAAKPLDCDDSDPKRAYPDFGCSDIQKTVQGLLSAAPYKTYKDDSSGRIADWPPYSGQRPWCAAGYQQGKNNKKCYLELPQRFLGSMCPLRCSAPVAMCSAGSTGHCSGNCWPIFGKCSCYCSVDASSDFKSGIAGKLAHRNGDLSTYFVCNPTTKKWVSLSAAEDYSYKGVSKLPCP